MRFSSSFFSIIVATLGLQIAAYASAGDWEMMSDEAGLKTYRKEVEGSPVVAFKGETEINASVPVVMQILSDPTLRKEWIAHLKESTNLKQVSKSERIEYNHTGAPWPLKDRDFVYTVKADLDNEKKECRILLQSIEDANYPPKSDKVRGQIVFGQYIVRAIDGGKRTWLSVEIQADPKGAVPTWVVNLFQKSWPRKTLENIKKIVARNNTAPHPDVKPWFDALFAAPAPSASANPSPLAQH